MKPILLFFIAASLWLPVLSQWSTSGTNIYNTNTGNVGIGTASPQELLHISSPVTYPRAIIQSTSSSGVPGFAIADNTGAEKWTWQYNCSNEVSSFFLAGFGNVLAFTNSGTVGINTTDTKGYTFAVNGSAIFTSARVKAYNYWPDFVFGETYHLPSLDSVSRYIQTNHHLPDVPSADSIQAAGIDLGATDAVLLKKIEELTLYVIQQKKQLEAQQAAITRLEKLVQAKAKN